MARKIASIHETTKAFTAEVVSANSGTTSDTWAAGNDSRILNAAPLGHTDHTGASPLMELAALGSGAVFHLLAGEGSTAPYVVGVGVDHGTITGILASVKDAGTGLASTLETTSTADAEGIYGQTFGPGKLVRLVAGGTATGPLIAIESTYGGTGNLLQWDTGTSDGKITPAGNVEVIGATASVKVKHAEDGSNPNIVQLEVATGSTLVKWAHYAGSSVYFSTVASTSSDSWRIRKAAASALGAETYQTMIELKGTSQIGFFGVTPASRQTLGAAATDAGTALTLANALRTALINLGLGQP